MGKKGQKRKLGEISTSASAASNVKKRVKYDELPEVQKKKLVLSDGLNMLDEYFKVLDWMLEWGCSEGFDFDGLKTLRCINGYPLIEVEVVYQQHSKKFLISRASLYVLAFYSSRGWRLFNDDEFDFKFAQGVVARQMKLTAKYDKSSPWTNLGLKFMINALADMDEDDDRIASDACLVFAVHLLEACRIKLIRLKIARSMMPCVSLTSDMMLQEVGDMLGSEKCSDILPSLLPIVVDLSIAVAGDSQVEGFISKFKQLCKAWTVYVLSQKKICPLPQDIADECGVKFIRTLKHSLSLLCNTSFDKIVSEWKTKFNKGTSPRNFLQEDLKFMESTVQRLQDS